ncbi:MAG: hypothetical protein QXK45_07310, partial [Thermofilaceae archaeon]
MATLLVLGSNVDTNGLVLSGNNTGDYRGSYYLKVFDLQRWWDLGYSQVLVRASVGAEWTFERVEGSVLDFALFWEDCTSCDSGEPPPVKNVNTLYEDEILRVTYVEGKWVVQVLWHQGGFAHWVYVNNSLFFAHASGSMGGGPSGEFYGEVLRIDLKSSGDSRADSYAVFYAVPKECFEHIDALAFAAAVGLDKREVSRLVPSVASVSRERGVVAFKLNSGVVCALTLVYDVQVGHRGRFVLVNPSNVSVSWVLEIRISNKSGRPRGPSAVSIPIRAEPYSVREVYLFGAAREEGLYVASYRLYANGTYNFDGYTFDVGERRLVTENGSVYLFFSGYFAQLLGRAAGDECLAAWGSGRTWAAQRIGLAGAATEADILLGGLLTIATGGEYVAAKLGGRAAAEAAARALVSRIASAAGKAARAALWADLVLHGALLEWEAYVDFASGRASWEVVADAAILASGPVTARVKPLAAALASGGAVMLFLGEPFDAAQQFADDLYAEASKYGNYSHCFIDGALEAFSTYAQEVEIAKWAGIVSTFVDLSKLVNNKHWLGYRQLAALSAFPASHGPIIPSYKFPIILRKYGKAPYIAMDHRRFGFNQAGEPRFYQLQIDAYGLRLSPKKVSLIDVISVGRYDVRVYVFENKDKMFGIFSG